MTFAKKSFGKVVGLAKKSLGKVVTFIKKLEIMGIDGV